MFKANTKDNRTSLLLTLNIFHIFFSVSEHLVQILSQPFEPILALCLYKKNLNRKLRYFHVANQWKLYIITLWSRQHSRGHFWLQTEQMTS